MDKIMHFKEICPTSSQIKEANKPKQIKKKYRDTFGSFTLKLPKFKKYQLATKTLDFLHCSLTVYLDPNTINWEGENKNLDS